ncbi:DUF1538 domain-containing protein [Thauera sp. ZXT1-4]|uniref:DUF1538 domain-containing protein n=1 Tax=Thauera sp. ZXT1-4 TaxID=3460294 RepID=UPI004040918C
MPIVVVVAVFQLAVIREVPDGLLSMAGGLLIVAIGVALFLQGLELGIFPIGKNLSNEFAKKGSLLLLMVFGFCLGFAAVIAEPALIAVASQAESISGGRIDGFTLRVLVALSVGAVVALGVVRTILGHSLHWYMIVGYLLVVTVTFFAPEEIVGLAYDSGGVTTSEVTVPLVTALGRRRWRGHPGRAERPPCGAHDGEHAPAPAAGARRQRARRHRDHERHRHRHPEHGRNRNPLTASSAAPRSAAR